MEERGSSTVGGTGFFGFLQLLFIGLKLGGKIKWSWIWVLSPTWISALLFLGVLIGVLIIRKIKE